MPRKKKEPEPEIIEVEAEVVEETALVSLDKKREVLAREREIKAMEAREKDLYFVEGLSNISQTIVEKMLESDNLQKFIDKLLKEGKGKDLQALMISLGITLDKREQLLGYDDTRRQQGLGGGRRTKFEVVFKGADGSQAGVRVETD